VRLPASNDTRLLVAGLASFVALLAYLAAAFANTHVLSGFATVNPESEVAPWTPDASKLIPVSLGKRAGFAVRVTLASRSSPKGGSYGAVVETLVPDPTPRRRYVVGLWLKGARPGRIGFELNEFRGNVSRYPVETTVPATARWHHFTFSTRVKGAWLGLAVYVYRADDLRHRTWFAVRNVTASTRGR
jgi:hypothetical protein